MRTEHDSPSKEPVHVLQTLASKPDLTEQQRLLHELQVHQIELEAQNRELRDAQEQLEESRSRYVDLFDFAPIGYCTFDLNGCILELNLTAALLFCVARAEAVSKPLTSLVRMTDPHALRRHLKACAAERVRVTTEVTFSTKGQPPVVVQMISNPVLGPSGNVIACRTALTNISELKISENVLRFLADASDTLSSSLEYANTLSAVIRLAVPVLADICFLDILDEQNQLERLDAAFADPSKAVLADAVKRSVPKADSMAPQAEVLRSGEARVLSDISSWPGCVPDAVAGMAKSVMLIPLTARGRTLGVLTLIMADSDRHYGSRELAIAQDVARRAAMALDNARLYEAAQIAIRARDDILAMVSHDLKQPLNGIVLATSTAEARLKDSAESKANGLLQIALRSARRMDRLLSDLLDCSSIQSGHLPIRKSETTVSKLFADVETAFSAQAMQKNIRLEIHSPREAIWLSCDEERIHQVLSNLITNAVKFTDEGGLITLRTEKRGENIVFLVSDSGVGISEAQMPRLFERFWQAEETSQKGRGLGLFIAKGIVSAHEGRIWVESQLGRGTTFFVSLPMGNVHARNGARSPDSVAAHATGILVVDDDPEIRGMLAGVLADEGYDVVQMPDGQKALKHLRQSLQMPGLILLDLHMPVMDGWQCLSELRDDPRLARIPVVVVSTKEFANDALPMGVEFLTKPVQLNALLDTVRRSVRSPANSPMRDGRSAIDPVQDV
ncbi:ATP-binding protein [Pendulispora brunnea]|uniref:histidine kinase n=1 Tax=Pendulispora brunnea TaxID=2905690 RepID=A0ABZ2KGF6_9BACT